MQYKTKTTTQKYKTKNTKAKNDTILKNTKEPIQNKNTIEKTNEQKQKKLNTILLFDYYLFLACTVCTLHCQGFTPAC